MQNENEFDRQFTNLTPKEADKRFRELSKPLHPDHNGDAQKFMALVEARQRAHSIRLPIMVGARVRVAGRWWKVVGHDTQQRLLLEGMQMGTYNSKTETRVAPRNVVESVLYHYPPDNPNQKFVLVTTTVFRRLVKRAKVRLRWSGVPNSNKGPFTVAAIELGQKLSEPFSAVDVHKALVAKLRLSSMQTASNWINGWRDRKWVERSGRADSNRQFWPAERFFRRTVRFGVFDW